MYKTIYYVVIIYYLVRCVSVMYKTIYLSAVACFLRKVLPGCLKVRSGNYLLDYLITLYL